MRGGDGSSSPLRIPSLPKRGENADWENVYFTRIFLCICRDTPNGSERAMLFWGWAIGSHRAMGDHQAFFCSPLSLPVERWIIDWHKGAAMKASLNDIDKIICCF